LSDAVILRVGSLRWRRVGNFAACATRIINPIEFEIAP
jgi:hypothetical protein